MATAYQTQITKANDIVRAAIDQQIAAGHEIGVQVAAYLDGELVVDTWSGFADTDSGRMVDGNTLFNRYSVTKAIIATALHIQADRGRLTYDAPVAEYWPEYAVNGKAATTVRHIITHRAGVPQMPEGVTPDSICDWDETVSRIGSLTPICEPGTKALYQSMTFGWLVGELVRRTDPQQRPIAQFIREEIAVPLGIADLWLGLPDSEMHRFARHVSAIAAVPTEHQPPLMQASMPDAIMLGPDIYAENAKVRRSGIPGVGGIFNARSEVRVWAMLAQGGELDGVRLLSRELVDTLYTMRDDPDEPDAVMYGVPIPLTIGGFWLGTDYPPTCAVGSNSAICHPGFGNSIGWADRERRLAVSICHNRMSQPMSADQDSMLPIAQAVRAALGMN